jgi:hypothetical protein
MIGLLGDKYYHLYQLHDFKNLSISSYKSKIMQLRYTFEDLHALILKSYSNL